MEWLGDRVAVLEPRAAMRRMKQTIQGRIQRVNYRGCDLTVVADGTVHPFTITPDCHLWFNDVPAILRCFHPLDPVTVILDENGHVDSMYSWDPVAAQ